MRRSIKQLNARSLFPTLLLLLASQLLKLLSPWIPSGQARDESRGGVS